MSQASALTFASLVNLIGWCACSYYVFVIKKAPIFHPVAMFLIYFLVGYVVRPLCDLLIGGTTIWNDTRFWPTPENIVYATLVDIVGLVAFVFIPPLMPGGLHDQLRMPRIQFKITQPIGFYASATAILLIALFSYYRLLGGSNADQLSGLITRTTADGGMALVNMSGYETVGAQFLPALLVVLYLRSGATRLNLALTAAYVVLRIYNGSERAGFVTILLALAVVDLIRRGGKYFRARDLIAGLALLFVFNLVGADRLAIRNLLFGGQSTTATLESYNYKRANTTPLPDFQEFESMTIVTSLVPTMTGGYNWFTQYETLLIRPIPRQWWYDKPFNTGRIILIKYGNFFWITVSMMGDAYTNFGIPSVVLVMALDGWLLSYFYKRTQRSRSPYTYALFIIVIANLPLLFRDGGWIASLYFVMASMLAASIIIASGGVQIVRARTNSPNPTKPVRQKIGRRFYPAPPFSRQHRTIPPAD